MQLRYGRTSLDVALEGHEPVVVERVFEGRALTGVEQIRARLLSALEAAGLDEFVRPGDKITIVVPDKTRYAMADVFLPAVLDALNTRGAADGAIEIAFALGIHPPQSEEEQRRILGTEASRRAAFFDHDAREAGFVELGTTRRGTPVMINRRVWERDKLIILGTITYHYFAGFGGGRKMLIPGVASAETCRANHILALTETGRHPLACAGRLDGNPVYEDGVEAVRLVDRPILAINAVLTPDRRLLDVFCGDIVDAHRAACEFYDRFFRVPIGSGAADVAIVSAGGAPRDINWIQAHKAVEMAFGVLRPGGSILALLECPQGTGHEDFLRWFDHPTLAEMRRALAERYQIYGQTAWNTRFKAQQCDILLLSSLPPEMVRRMGMHPIAGVEEGLRRLCEKHGQRWRPVVFPHGATFLPVACGV
ncbi:MAG: nickel-dependent lactate racemase [Candidatus Sumerlaeia bacterium]